MRVFKPTYSKPDGKGGTRTKPLRRYYVEFRDSLDRRRRIRAFSDRGASQEFARKIERLVAFRVNGEEPDVMLAKWLENLPDETRKKLAGMGLLEKQRMERARPLEEHLKEWEASMLARETTEKHAKQTLKRARRVIEGCGFQVWREIESGPIEHFLHGLRKGKRSISIRTSNFYVQAIKQFCRWMVVSRRASESPVAHLKKLNPDTDLRHKRRALTARELKVLIATTAQEPARWGMTGPQRSLLYRFSAQTGLRASEIKSLTKGSFTFDVFPPNVTVRAAYSKRRREDVILLREDLARELQDHLKNVLPSSKAFQMTDVHHLAKMLRKDLDAAKIPYVDDSGRYVEFHALRHTFISLLAQAEVHPKTAQVLARHSTISLTLDLYTHSYLEGEVKALEKLPDLSCAACEENLEATGTEGKEGESGMSPSMSRRAGKSGIPRDSTGGEAGAKPPHNSGRETGGTPSEGKALPP
jgi:integrase